MKSYSRSAVESTVCIAEFPPASAEAPSALPKSPAVATSHRWRALVYFLFVLACGEFLVRGPARALGPNSGFNDFLSPYIQSRAWVRGIDPYDPQSLLELWPSGATRFQFLSPEASDGSILVKRGIPTAYPPTTFAVIAPLTLLPWPIANLVWTGINIFLFAWMLLALVSLTRIPRNGPCLYLFIAFALALAPFHTGLATANLAVAATELSVIAVWTADRKYEVATGVLLAFAISLKPQIGLCLLAYFLLRRRGKMFGTALLAIALCAALAVLRLEVTHVNWEQSYVRDNQALFATGILSDFRPPNPTRFGLLNLQLVLYPLLGSANAANKTALIFGVLTLLVWSGLVLRRKDWGNGLLPLTTIAVLSLLPVYHRFYDAALLIFPLCWYMLYQKGNDRVPSLGWLFIVPFLIPGGTLLQSLQENGHIPAALSGSWFWNDIVMPHEVWTLMVLSLILLYGMYTAPAAETAS